MLGQLLILVASSLCFATSVCSDEISYFVDLKTPPPNTFMKVGNDNPTTAIGETAKFDLAIKSNYYFNEKNSEIAKKHAALLAHTSLYNASRIESMLKRFPDFLDQTKLKVNEISLSVVSASEIERDGVKLLRIEIEVSINMHCESTVRATQHKKREIWEFDGKKLKLVEAPDNWSYLSL